MGNLRYSARFVIENFKLIIIKNKALGLKTLNLPAKPMNIDKMDEIATTAQDFTKYLMEASDFLRGEGRNEKLISSFLEIADDYEILS
jgi:hypothetical protein